MKDLVLALGASLAAAAVAALGAELGARAYLRARGRYYRYRPYARRRLLIDRSALPALTPVAEVEINGDGERGGPVPRRGENVWRGLIVGGSAAECYYLDQACGWGAVAARILSQPEHLTKLGAERVHIGNVARAILPCREIHVMLSRILPRYERLDAILVMVGASDVVSWLEAKAPPSIDHRAAPLSSVFEQHPEGPFGFSPRRTALRQILGTLHRRFFRPLTVTPDSGDWLHRVRKMRAEARKIVDQVPDPAPMLDHFETWLRALLRLSMEKARRVIVVRQPWLGDALSPDEASMLWNFGFGRPYKEDVDVYCTPRVASELMSRIDARAAAVADELGLEHIDLVPILERSARTYYDFLHFTPQGAETVGRKVAAVLLGDASP